MAPLVYFVRHGETDWNAEGRLQGQADTDINAKGRAQATRNGEMLARLVEHPAGFDFVASPLRRTRETMERVRAAMGLDPSAYRTDARLMELSFGDWQGFTYPELEKNDPGCGKRRARDKWNFVPPGAGAESYALLTKRVLPFLEEISGPTICVTHGGIFRAIFRQYGGYSEHQASRMHVPQDKFLRMLNGTLEWL